MRKLVIAGLLSAVTASAILAGTNDATAAEGPWCHTWGGSQGPIENCRLQTLEMCRYEIRGNGGSCSPNPRWHANSPERPNARRKG
jgi:Protein of unknown function (DUF3551)